LLLLVGDGFAASCFSSKKPGGNRPLFHVDCVEWGPLFHAVNGACCGC
jgi:hypothetical protein